jgi:hypothetical protein
MKIVPLKQSGDEMVQKVLEGGPDGFIPNAVDEDGDQEDNGDGC